MLSRVTAVVPDEVDWWSNLGYFRWELGMAEEAEGRAKEATGFYEASLAAHEKALAIRPNDPASFDDCVLLLYYHLKREDERVESYLRRAIEEGEKMLAGPSLKDPRRRFYDEATGNAYQNLGVLLFEKKKDLREAKRLFEKSLEHYPFSRARVRWFLGRIERELAEESGRGSR